MAAPTNEAFTDWLNRPPIITVHGFSFYTCQGTGMPIRTRTGVPGWLIGHIGDNTLYGCFRDANILLRWVRDAGEVIPEYYREKLLSWFAATYGEGTVSLPDGFVTLERFGGTTSDDEYCRGYTPMATVDACTMVAAEDAEARENERIEKARKRNASQEAGKPLSFDASVRAQLDPEAVTFLLVARWALDKRYYWTQVVTPEATHPFKQAVMRALDADILPATVAGPVISVGPRSVSRKGQKYLNAEARPGRAKNNAPKVKVSVAKPRARKLGAIEGGKSATKRRITESLKDLDSGRVAMAS